MTGLLLVEPNRRYAAEVVVMLSSLQTKRSEYNNGRRACDLLEVKHVHRKVLDRNSMLLDHEVGNEESELVTECEDLLRERGQLQENGDGGAGLCLPQIFIDGIFAGRADELQGLEDNGLLGPILRRELCVKCAVETGTVAPRSSDQCAKCGSEFEEVLPGKKMIDDCITLDQEVLDKDCNSGSEDRFNRYAEFLSGQNKPRTSSILSKIRLFEPGGKHAPKAQRPLLRKRQKPRAKQRNFAEAPLIRISSADSGREILRAALLQSDDESAEKTYAEPGEKTYPYEALKHSSNNCPKDVDPSKKEAYLSDVDFHNVFGMDFATFRKMPPWKREQAKKANGLF